MSPLAQLMFALTWGGASGAATIPSGATLAKIVDTHNSFRCSMCNTPPLKWDAAIANNAKAYMDTGAGSGHCPVRDGSVPGCVGNGENMYSGTAGDDAAEWERAVNMWSAGEIDCYNFDTGSNTCTSGHMTQVAWDLSTKIGCASNSAATGAMKTICMYSPAGNMNGPSNYVNHVHKCPTAKQFEYYTGSASCCNGPQANCKNGKCGWEYAKATTTKGCPAGSSCSVHASCSTAKADTTPNPEADTPNPKADTTPNPKADTTPNPHANLETSLASSHSSMAGVVGICASLVSAAL